MSHIRQEPATEPFQLDTVALFEGLPPDCLGRISSDMVRYFSTGMEILHEGDPGSGLVVLLSGQARVLRNGTYIVTRSASTTGVVGEQAILDGEPCSATVVADGMVKALVVPRKVTSLLLENRRFVANIARILSFKLREATGERSVRYEHEERLFSEFSAHVSPEVAAWLLAKGASYGNPRFVEAVVLMADIRSFTDKCSAMRPETIGSELSTYLDAIVDVIHRFDGFVDKFIGDAVLAVWGVTDSGSNLAAKAFECAVRMTQTAESLRFGGEPIRIGVGLELGRVFVGNVGGQGKRQFTVLGTTVNLASRLQSETKPLGANVVIGPAAYAALPDKSRENLSPREREIRGIGKLTVYCWAPDASPRFLKQESTTQ